MRNFAAIFYRPKRKIDMNKLLTDYVAMNPSHCVACWKCVEQCPKKAIGKIEVLWHKHVVFQNPDACVGCKKCIKTCPQGVFFVPDANYKVPNLWQRIKNKINVECLLPLLLLATIVTGIKLHVVGHRDGQVEQHAWLVAHVVSTIIFTVFTIWHIAKRKRLSVK